MRKYDELQSACERLGFMWFTKELSLNFVWERTNKVITNRFTDWLHIAYLENGEKKVLSIPATTKPGLKGSILEPVTVNGVTGTAIIKAPQQVRSGWKFIDSFKEFSKYPYFRQVGKVDYWRDGDKDTEIDPVQDQEDKIFGTHWHRMSNNGTYGSGQVNNWSLGCMGAPEPEFKKILDIVRRSAKVYGYLFTGTILNSEDIA
jgi:hypothetical protein